MKRFTETDKWKDPWFRKLDPEVKLLWNFICDQCDNAGVWDPDEELFHFCSGAQVPLTRGLEALGERVECLKNGKWWIRKFVDFQFGSLVDTNNCHRSVKALLSKHDISTPGQGHPRGTPGVQEKEKEKEKDKERGVGGEKYGDARIALHFLNEATGRHFRELDTNLSVISARLSEPEVTLEGVKQMIARQCQRWKGTDQEEYLRPETLFGKQKFDNYYAAKDQPVTQYKNGSAVKPGLNIHKLTSSTLQQL